MFVKSLSKVAFILGLGVVAGCDDPEVQSKVADVLEHGAVSAEVTCNLYDNAAPGNGTIPNNVLYNASKNIDGSCLSQLCIGFSNDSYRGPNISFWSCQTLFSSRSSVQSLTCEAYVQYDPHDGRAGIDKPFRPGIDGTYAYVDSGNLYLEVRDYYFTYPGNNCNGGPCTDPEPWFFYDITDSGCTGRNLEAFGVTP